MTPFEMYRQLSYLMSLIYILLNKFKHSIVLFSLSSVLFLISRNQGEGPEQGAHEGMNPERLAGYYLSKAESANRRREHFPSPLILHQNARSW